MSNKRIIAVHLLNDFSGSPFVLRQALEVLVKDRYKVELFTATPSGNGFLSNIAGVKEHQLFYKWNSNRFITLFLYLYSQLRLFWKIVTKANRKDIVYINSILPFGAAIAARIRGAKVIYHVHEVSIKPRLLRKFLLFIAGITASKGLFVSNDVLSRTRFKKEATVVYNALPAGFISRAMQQHKKQNTGFTVLMICSLKAYKGVREFLGCAARLPRFRFQLVLNASEEEIGLFFHGEKIPSNVNMFPAQPDVHPFYQEADVVVNLSLPDQWVETFGMTILEGMYYKRPVIIPNIGGITELVTDEVEGYRINPRDINEVCDQLQMLATCPSLYQRMSVQAFKKAQQFSPVAFSEGIRKIFKAAGSPEYAEGVSVQPVLFAGSANGKQSLLRNIKRTA